MLSPICKVREINNLPTTCPVSQQAQQSRMTSNTPKQFDIIIKEADKVEVLVTNKMEYVKEAEKQNHILSSNPTAKIQMKTTQSNGRPHNLIS